MRYIVNFDSEKVENKVYDVVIIGSGIAGLYVALHINGNYRIAILCKRNLTDNNTSLAQGGVACSLNKEDSPSIHFNDTLEAGSRKNNPSAVKIFVEEARSNVLKLIDLGIEFDMDEKGELLSTGEGGHSRRRIIYSGGDSTGMNIHRGLLHAVQSLDNVTFFENTPVIDILTSQGRCYGVLAMKENSCFIVYARAVVVATGGCGNIYRNTTNTESSTCDGVAMARRCGCDIEDMEFVQFHPTALYSNRIKEKYGRFFLISEAVRGEGAVLRNSDGETFMYKYHEMKDLAPRDVVSRAIYNEMKKENSQNVFLDITHKSRHYLKNRFPSIFGICLEAGIDISKDMIPVVPVAHYMIGGMKTNFFGSTNVDYLFACGECADAGVHGANRLASNSLPESLVFSRRTAECINEAIEKRITEKKKMSFNENNDNNVVDWESIKNKIKNIMNDKVGIERNYKDLIFARDELYNIYKLVIRKDIGNVRKIEVKNMVSVALLIVESAINRSKSCGCHYRVG
ncbi:MAG: L-aspartate oxidase [Candidatus Eremiobacteraeota bacterium]|nr:L-aspartate oxidase [Candidatus Eremiobacteraeota bacterium]